MKAHIVTVIAYCEDVETYRNTFKGRNHKRAEMLKASETIKTRGEIHVTEENAKAWAVWTFKAGDKQMVHSHNIQKA